MKLSVFLIPTYSQMLRAMSGWLNKACAHFEDADSILGERMAPDMFPLATQIRYSCVQAYEATAYLMDIEQLDVRDELIAKRQEPGTMREAQSHIEATLKYLEQLSPEVLDSGLERDIALKLPNGFILDMTGEQYVRDWAVPQIYFHVTTAYVIMRHLGVELGKADYVPHALTFLRTP